MEKIITYNFGDNFIDSLTTFLCDNFLKGDNDFSRVACVFGGRRPALFLYRALSQRLGRCFIPPRFFSIDEFIDYIIPDSDSFPPLGELDSAFLIYTLAKKNIPGLLKKEAPFDEFLPWAREIVSFIEQLDLEDIPSAALRTVEKSAAIGYEIPENINRILQHIVSLREIYHRRLRSQGFYSRGMRYREASRCVGAVDFEEFEKIIFCNFFYLHATESRIIKAVLDKGKGVCIFQGSQDDWSVLEKCAKELGGVIRPPQTKTPASDFSLYQGFDVHSQVCLVREILKKLNYKNKSTLIVVPRPETIISLLTEISTAVDEFNVSMGYPLRRSSLFELFNALLKVQESRKNGRYYTKDYLALLRHPLIKNLKLAGEAVITRVMIHKIEEILKGEEDSSIGGSLFLSLDEIEDEGIIYLRTSQTLAAMNIGVSTEECRALLKDLHALLFRGWEQLENFRQFAQCLEVLLEVLVDKSKVTHFPFNLKVIEKLHDIREELSNASFSEEPFSQREIWEVFKQKLESEVISFVGSPLRGVQILGLFEARSLNFDNVIVIDANESILPKLKIYEPLIPREVMLSLGLNRLEKEEEIQRYQFMRLISASRSTHLVYEENRDKEKSRFIEELLWRRQQKEGRLDVARIPRASFTLKVCRQKSWADKTDEMLDFLRKESYSASRINTYLNCPLQFYYQYVLGLQEKEDLLEEPESTTIGTFIHELLEETFKPFLGQRPVIDTKFRRYFFKVMEKKFAAEIERRMKSDSFLLKRIIHNRLSRFLDREIERNVSKIICLEEKRTGTIVFNSSSLSFNYTVDRIDELPDNSIIIIDYKTGGVNLTPKRLKGLQAMEMSRVSIKEHLKSFQLPLYYYFVNKEFPGARVNAELYSIRTLERKPFISEGDYGQREQVMRICLEALEAILCEIFDLSQPFIADKDERTCPFCAFSALCR